LQENVTGGSAPTLNITVDPTTNRINTAGFSYDAAGNLTHTPDGKTYAYDSENRTSQGNEGTYYYGANGRRLASVSSDGTAGTWYFRGPNGIELNLVASSWGCGLYSGLYSGFCVSGSAPEKLYFAGRLVMQGDAQSALSMSTVTDRLGSVVQTSSYQGSDYYPYGGNPSNFLPNQTAFATYEAAGTSLLYAQNRFYDSARGRFTSPDRHRKSMHLRNPLSFNRYAYVMGDPINNSDPSGQDAQCGPGQTWMGEGCYTYNGSSAGFYSDYLAYAADPSGNGNSDEEDDSVDKTPSAPPDCISVILKAINSQFGTDLTIADVSTGTSTDPQEGGQVNLDIGSMNLTGTQFNAIQPGRYPPSSIWGRISGYGPSLHVVDAPSDLDPNVLTFTNVNDGGVYTVSFTAHIDSAWADNPLGALFHWVSDVLGANTRNPCPH